MTNFNLTRAYNETMPQLQTTDKAHANTFNPLFNQLLNNDASHKDRLDGHDASLADIVTDIKSFGAIGDGNSHPLSSVYSTLAQAQAKYPCATALTDEIDWCAIQTAVNSLPSMKYGGSGGGRVKIPVGDYRINKPISIPSLGTILEGNSGYGSILHPTTAFSGNSLVLYQQTRGAQLNKFVSMKDILIMMDNVQAYAVTVMQGYDGVYFSNIEVDGVADAYSAFQFIPDPNQAITISQTFILENIIATHQNNTATAPLFLFNQCQEINLFGCKGIGKDSTSPANPYQFIDCRGVTLYGCSAANSANAGIKITTSTRFSQGFVIDGCTFENVGLQVEAIGTASYDIERISVRSPREEGNIGGFHFQYCTLCDIDSKTRTVQIDSGCNQMCIFTQLLSNITDNGTNTMIISRPNAVDSMPKIYPSLGVIASAVPKQMLQVLGKSGYLQTLWNANSSADYGFSIGYVDPSNSANNINILGTSQNHATLSLYAGNQENARVVVPSNNQVGLMLQKNINGTLSLVQVSLGAADSGGTGYRTLIVPN